VELEKNSPNIKTKNENPITIQTAIGLPSFPLDHISFFVRKDFSSEGKVVRKTMSLIIRKIRAQILLNTYDTKDRKKSDHKLRNCSNLFCPAGLKPSKLSWKNLLDEGRFIVKDMLNNIIP